MFVTAIEANDLEGNVVISAHIEGHDTVCTCATHSSVGLTVNYRNYLK